MKRAALLLSLLVGGVPAWADCALDGFSSTQGSGGATTFTTAPITTTSSNDVIVIEETTLLQGTAFSQVMGVTGGGLSWVQRFRLTGMIGGCDTGGCANEVSEWWAVAASPLTGQTFALSMNSVWQGAGGFTHTHVFGVSGVTNPASPWDANGSLPALAVNATLTLQPMLVPGVSTTNADVMVLAGCLTNDDTGPSFNCVLGVPTAPAGMTQVTGYRSVQAFQGLFNLSAVWYKVVASPFAGATFNLNNSSIATNVEWLAYVDAIACSAVAPPPSHGALRPFVRGWPW